MAFLDTMRGHTVANTDEESPDVSLPFGLTPERFIEQADQGKPTGYASTVQTALMLYRGQGRTDTITELRKVYPKTADHMLPVEMGLMEYVVKKEAAVFAGTPKFELVDDAGEPIEEAGGVKWSDVVDAAEAQRHLQEVNRLTRFLKRMFLRVTWDADGKRLDLTPFTPDCAHVLFDVDARGRLTRAMGVLFDLEPLVLDGRKVRRWEFWSAQPDAAWNFIIDEKGNVSGSVDADGAERFDNPYQDDAGNPVLPIVSFSDDDVSAGYWLLPSEQLIAAQRQENILWTDLLHVVRKQGWGQWKSETQASETNPQDWNAESAPIPAAGESLAFSSRVQRIARRALGIGVGSQPSVTMGPDSVVQVPKGRTLEWVGQGAPTDKSAQAIKDWVRHFLNLRGVPPGRLLGEPGAAASGYALRIENQSLEEVRTEQIALYRRPVHDLIALMRLVWNAHQESNPTRFPLARPRFTESDVGAPVDPVQQNADDDFDLRNRLKTRAEVLAKREGIPLTEAEERIAKVDAATRPVNTVAPSAVAQMMLGRPTPQPPRPAPTGEEPPNEPTPR